MFFTQEKISVFTTRVSTWKGALQGDKMNLTCREDECNKNQIHH